jgi:aspartate carbamoyltransferase regulatory subunit
MNVPSDRLDHKDGVQVENRQLSPDELDVLARLAPDATINIIRDYEVVEKNRVERPDRVVGVLECPNRACISRTEEPVASKFEVHEDGVRCEYCGTIIREDIAEHIESA